MGTSFLGSIPDILALVPGPGLLFGLLLAAAILGGYVAHALRVPRVVGYLFSGAAVKLGLVFALDTSGDSEAATRLWSRGKGEFPFNAECRQEGISIASLCHQ